MNDGWDRMVRDLEVAMALVDTARAAQTLLGSAREDSNPLNMVVSATDADDLRDALNRWLAVTGQTVAPDFKKGK